MTCPICHDTGHYYVYGKKSPTPCVYRKCSFRFLLICNPWHAQVITQDARRRVNMVTGSYDVTSYRDWRQVAKEHGCSVIMRPKAAA